LAKSDATEESLKAKTDALSEKAMKLGEAVYKAQQEAQNAAGANNADDNKSDGARDADFSEKK
jgi:molecular chaperone DnaK